MTNSWRVLALSSSTDSIWMEQMPKTFGIPLEPLIQHRVSLQAVLRFLLRLIYGCDDMLGLAALCSMSLYTFSSRNFSTNTIHLVF